MVTTRQSTQQKTTDAIKKNPRRKLLPRAYFRKWVELPVELQRLVLTKLDGPYRHRARQCSKSMNNIIATIPTIIPFIEFGVLENTISDILFMKWLDEEPEDNTPRPKEWNNKKECEKDRKLAIKTFFNFFSANPASIVEVIDFNEVFFGMDGVNWMKDFVIAADKRDIKIRAKSIIINLYGPQSPLRYFVELFDENVLEEMRMTVGLAATIKAIRNTVQFKSCESFSLVHRGSIYYPEIFRIGDFFHFAKLDTKHVSWTPTDIHRLIQVGLLAGKILTYTNLLQNIRSKEEAKESDKFSMEPGLDEEEVWKLFDFVPAKKVNGTGTGITRRFTMQHPELVLEVKITMDAICGEVFKL
ncbi:hypothetical protein CRE_21272 [Caenorhabditis remanei]|uniref:F-box domain-containing protein n=1 Tax=Caenorhabditis remanei TaxID=31234 RepID=E3MF73_CAERE|nr:hypothetical protein CRE_21272 [Caenorhabditis remanei]